VRSWGIADVLQHRPVTVQCAANGCWHCSWCSTHSALTKLINLWASFEGGVQLVPGPGHTVRHQLRASPECWCVPCSCVRVSSAFLQEIRILLRCVRRADCGVCACVRWDAVTSRFQRSCMRRAVCRRRLHQKRRSCRPVIADHLLISQ